MTTFSTPELEPYLVLGQELMRHVYAEESPEEINTWLRAQLARLSAEPTAGARLLWAESFELYDRIMERRIADAGKSDEERLLLTWPWETWTRYLDPLEPGMLALIAAADGAGKTLTAECIAEHWAKQGRNVVFLHFELNRAIMLDRRMVRHSGIPRRTLRLGKLAPFEIEEHRRADERLKAWRGGITYVHTPGWTVERALVEVRNLIEENLCDVFVVDYLEKAGAAPSQVKLFGTNVFVREAHDVEQIKSFSEQQEVPVLLLAQLNKIGKGQSFATLDRTAVRGAGEKTEKANVVILLHRESTEVETVQVRIDKNTIGPTGSFTQYMDVRRFRIQDIQEDN